MDAAVPSRLRATRRRVANPLSLAAARLVRVFGWWRSFLFCRSSAALWRNIFRAVQLRPWSVVFPCLLQHVIVRCRLVFVIVGFAIIFSHWMIDKFVPHENPPQVRVSVEMYAIKIKDFTLLKFGAAPDRRERGQPCA